MFSSRTSIKAKYSSACFMKSTIFGTRRTVCDAGIEGCTYPLEGGKKYYKKVIV